MNKTLIFSMTLALLLGGCHKKGPVANVPAPPPAAHPSSSNSSRNYFEQGEKYFKAGEYAAAAQAYDQYLQQNPGGSNQDKALFKQALALALPSSNGQDLGRAMGLLKRLAQFFPDSVYKPEADLMVALYSESERRRADAATKDDQLKALKSESDKLKQELEKLKQIDMQRRTPRPPK